MSQSWQMFLLAAVQVSVAGAGWVCIQETAAKYVPVQFVGGNVECMATDGRNCLRRASMAACNALIATPPAVVAPLACGTAHTTLYGVPGYGTVGHWCQIGWNVFVPTGCTWVAGYTISPNAAIDIGGGFSGLAMIYQPKPSADTLAARCDVLGGCAYFTSLGGLYATGPVVYYSGVCTYTKMAPAVSPPPSCPWVDGYTATPNAAVESSRLETVTTGPDVIGGAARCNALYDCAYFTSLGGLHATGPVVYSPGVCLYTKGCAPIAGYTVNMIDNAAYGSRLEVLTTGSVADIAARCDQLSACAYFTSIGGLYTATGPAFSALPGCLYVKACSTTNPCRNGQICQATTGKCVVASFNIVMSGMTSYTQPAMYEVILTATKQLGPNDKIFISSTLTTLALFKTLTTAPITVYYGRNTCQGTASVSAQAQSTLAVTLGSNCVISSGYDVDFDLAPFMLPNPAPQVVKIGAWTSVDATRFMFEYTIMGVGATIGATAVGATTCTSVTGYAAFPDSDITGNNMVTIPLGQSVAVLAAGCDLLPACKGFNSLGWTKGAVPPSAFKSVAGTCLYVKGAAPTPVDCVYTQSLIGTCSVTCGGGIQNYINVISTRPAFGGAACPATGSTTQPLTQACNPQACPVAPTVCPYLAGYTVAIDKAQTGPGTDIMYIPGSYQFVSTVCNSLPDCVSYNYINVGGWLKGAGTRVSTATGICSYTKMTCTPVAGYVAYPNSDNTGSDIVSSPVTIPSVLATACNVMGSCVAFNSAGILKSAVTNIQGSINSCLYVKSAAVPAPRCPAIVGYSALNADSPGNNLNAIAVTPSQLDTACNNDARCIAFNDAGLLKSAITALDMSLTSSCIYIKKGAMLASFAMTSQDTTTSTDASSGSNAMLYSLLALLVVPAVAVVVVGAHMWRRRQTPTADADPFQEQAMSQIVIDLAADVECQPVMTVDCPVVRVESADVEGPCESRICPTPTPAF